MINDSRIDIYDYIADLMKQVTNNVYSMGEPTETTEDDADNGFVVIRVGTLNDDSEFSCEAYLWARCYVTAYVPKKTRGRLNKTLYKEFESGINDVINTATEDQDGQYFIVPDTMVSTDDDETAQQGNQYHVFTKSFIVASDNQGE